VAGLSAGGAMAAILAEQAPDIFSAVGIMAGVALHASHDVESAYEAMHPGVAERDIAPIVARQWRRTPGYRRLRATIWSGDEDKLVAPENASVLARQFSRLLDLGEGAATVQERDGAEISRWSDASGRVRVESWRVEGMGHAWSGGSFRGSHTFPEGPAATEAMLRFFLDEPLDLAPVERIRGRSAAG
jgi:poly(3-hydroxybutyrate) depolymerase